MRIILPKTFVDLRQKKGPLFFLAGPVRGGGNWQIEMARQLNEMSPDCVIAIPCRWSCVNPLYQYRMEGNEEHFDRQLTWERYYLEYASQSGCIVFWLPRESKTEPHPGPEPYGMDTRGELGEWRGRMMLYRPLGGENRPRVVVGAEKDFLGLSQIRRNFNRALGYTFPIENNIASTARAAVGYAIP